MDDLDGLSWASPMKNQQQHTPLIPPSKPQRSSGVNPTVSLSGKPLSTNVTSGTSTNDDAFSGLVEFGTKKKLPDTSTLSLNEHRVQQQQQNLTSFNSIPLQPSTSNITRPSPSQNIWPSLTTQPSSTLLSTSPTPKQSFSGQQSTPLLQSSKPTLQAPLNKKTNDAFVDLLGSSDFGNKFGSQKNQSLDALKSTPHTSRDSTTAEQWNFDFLDSGLSSSKKAPSTNSSSFDPFDILLEAPAVPRTMETRISHQEDDGNPLGILAEPVPMSSPKIIPQEHIKSTNSTYIEQTSSTDHLIAQIVDMGFTASQAKAALSATNGGNDVAAAIELLLQERDNEESSGLIASKSSKGRGGWRKQIESSDEDEDDEYNEKSRIGYRVNQMLKQEDSDEEKPEAQKFSSLEQQIVTTGNEDKPVTSGSIISSLASRLRSNVNSTSKSAPMEQKTAAPPKPPREQPSDPHPDNILPDKEQYLEARQAAFNMKKEKLAAQASELGGFLYKSASGLIKQGKDKFGKAMEDFTQPASGSTSDEESDPISGKWTAVPEEPLPPRVKKQTDDTPYISPARRRPVKASPSVPSASPVLSSPAPSTSSPINISQARPPRPPRPVIPADPQQLLACETFKQRGNEFFKLGQFGEADSAYTKAIESLPQKHEQLILVYNNRAAARLKIGEHKTTIQDCETILEIVGEGWLDCNDPTATGINFKEQVIKALTRQAQALENLEKYSEAVTTLKKLEQVEGTRSKSLNDSIRRCEKAQSLLDGKTDIKISGFESDSIIFDDPSSSRSNLNPFTADVIAASRSTPSSVDPNKSAAVAKMRAQAAQAEAQDAEKLRLHDSVEAKLLSWKQGKEKNVRALLTSLDSVLWTGTGWKNVGMAEVIEVNKVKIVYMRAIGKVHPDKLKPNTTIEQRLLANGIFGALNEAWDDFKNQNALK